LAKFSQGVKDVDQRQHAAQREQRQQDLLLAVAAVADDLILPPLALEWGAADDLADEAEDVRYF